MNELRVRAAGYLLLPYERVIIPEDDGTYRGEIREFPGCLALADTPVEALEALEDIAVSWVEGALASNQPIPLPANGGFMALIERIEADRDAARRESRSEDTAFYSYLIAKARDPGKNQKPPRESTDEEIVGVVQKIIRENDETLATAQDQGAERLRRQNKLLQAYLPNQLSEEKLTEIIAESIRMLETGGDAKSKKMLGPIMKALKDGYAGQYAPALASQIASRLIDS